VKGKRATLLVNPAARRVARGPAPAPAAVARYLDGRGVATRLVQPGSPAEAVAAARDSAEAGDDLLFAFGGDGTQRDAAQGLAGSGTALAALPGGTVNIWCIEAGIPARLRAALDAHISGQVTPMDLGFAGGRAFMLMASLGWDAAVARSVSPRLKRRLGTGAYILRALVMAPRFRTVPARWRSGVAVYQGPLAVMVLSITRVYGGRVQFSPGALANDGLLDVVALCPASRPEALRLAVATFRSQLPGASGVLGGRFSALDVETPGIPVQLDGDYVGETPMSFEVLPGALRVSVPAGKLPPVLGG
jgi:YegS/Rv2252/BmrU family lipid kinase